ncbi:MAG: 2-hydroxyacyl-CoA dehydratase family protein [Desulfobacteraceae bacterium]
MSLPNYRPGTKVGLTTTVPVEVILAAGLVPVDLNNLFIASNQAHRRVAQAEEAGFPRTVCAWIKGIYSTLLEYPEIPMVIAVTQGDCSNTHALMELLQVQGRELIPFAFPFSRDRGLLRQQIEQLMAHFRVEWPQVRQVQASLAPIRQNLHTLDRLTWEEGLVSGQENFQFLIDSSDFNSDVTAFAEQLNTFLEQARRRPRRSPLVRLGLIGIPPIFSDLFDYLQSLKAEVVYNEIPRQFSMPFARDDLIEQYLAYTYPYDVFARIDDIAQAIKVRQLDGLIHYTQNFCFRQTQDLLLRQRLAVPMLTMEGDRPTALDHRTRLRLEAFVDVLRR